MTTKTRQRCSDGYEDGDDDVHSLIKLVTASAGALV